jgi:DNA-nicking Smr family endonuclease
MSGRRGLTEDERAIWATVTRKIRPLEAARKAAKKAADSAAGPPPIPRKAAPIKAPTPASKTARIAKAPPPPPPLAPLSRREKQRAARGHDSIDGRLDLHGHTQNEAHAALLRFLRRQSANEARLVLVITGKSGVLRRQVPQWLALPDFRMLVISAEPAAINHGGEGALYIKVRRGRG